jgi:copper chaperone CopZ
MVAAVCGYATSMVIKATADLFSPDKIAIAVELGCISIPQAVRAKIIVPIAVDVNFAMKITPHQDIAAAVCGYALSIGKNATAELFGPDKIAIAVELGYITIVPDAISRGQIIVPIAVDVNFATKITPHQDIAAAVCGYAISIVADLFSPDKIAIAVELGYITIPEAVRGQIIVPIAVDVNVATKITPHQDIAAAVCGYAISSATTSTAELFSPDQIAIAVELGYITIVSTPEQIASAGELGIRGQIIVPIAVDVNVAIKRTPHQDIAAAVCGYAMSMVIKATADLFSPDQIAIAVELGCITIVDAVRAKIIVPIAVDVNVAKKITPHQDIAAAVCGYALSIGIFATADLFSPDKIAIAVELGYITIVPDAISRGQIIVPIAVDVNFATKITPHQDIAAAVCGYA